MKKAIISVSMISIILATFFLGAYFSNRGMTQSVLRMQAELNFAHLQIYNELQKDHQAGCKNRVASRLEFIINEQKLLMAEYVQEYNDQQFEDYINLRDSDLISELQSYDINWNKVWSLPDCKLKGKLKGDGG